MLILLVVLAFTIQKHHRKRVSVGLLRKKLTVYVNGVVDEHKFELEDINLPNARNVYAIPPKFDTDESYDSNSTTTKDITLLSQQE